MGFLSGGKCSKEAWNELASSSRTTLLLQTQLLALQAALSISGHSSKDGLLGCWPFLPFPTFHQTHFAGCRPQKVFPKVIVTQLIIHSLLSFSEATSFPSEPYIRGLYIYKGSASYTRASEASSAKINCYKL